MLDEAVKQHQNETDNRIASMRSDDLRMADADYVLRWVQQSTVPANDNIRRLAERALGWKAEFPHPYHGDMTLRHLPEHVIRDAIAPVADWFDLDGEEGEAMSLRSVVQEIAAMLDRERRENIRLRSAARDVVKRHEAGYLAGKSDSVAIERLKAAMDESR